MTEVTLTSVDYLTRRGHDGSDTDVSGLSHLAVDMTPWTTEVTVTSVDYHTRRGPDGSDTDVSGLSHSPWT